MVFKKGMIEVLNKKLKVLYWTDTSPLTENKESETKLITRRAGQIKPSEGWTRCC